MLKGRFLCHLVKTSRASGLHYTALTQVLVRHCSQSGSNSVFHSSNDKSTTITTNERYITKTEVERFMSECMKAVGTPAAKASMLAANLSEADFRGHFSHGLNRLSYYVADIRSKNCDPKADPAILKEGPCTAWVDGNNGLGVVVGTYCMKMAIEKAKDSGIGWVVAKGSNHFGICQWYTEMAMKNGLIGMASTNTSPLVAPTRAKKTVFGTNPISVGAPAGRNGDSFLLDMSTSAVAVGKIEMQMRKQEPLPSLGWALGADGKPTTDANEAFYHGSGLMPLGGEEVNSGYKGYGLAMFVELICGLMSGSKYGHNIRHWTSYAEVADLGQCFIAIDPECFAPGMSNRLQDLMSHLRQLEPTDPSKPVLVPGDPERMSMQTVKAKGAIFYTEDHIRTYRELAKELNVTPMQHYQP